MARLFVAYEQQGEQSPLAGAGDALLDAQARAQEIREREEERRLKDKQIRVGERRNELESEALKQSRQDTLFERKYRARRDRKQDELDAELRATEQERYETAQERQARLDEEESKRASKALGIEEERARTGRMDVERKIEEGAQAQATKEGQLARARKAHGAVINVGTTKLTDKHKSTSRSLAPSQAWVEERKAAIETAIHQYNAATDPAEAARLAATVSNLQAEALEDYDQIVGENRAAAVNEEIGDLMAVAQDPDLAIPARLIATAQDARTPESQRNNLRILVEEWREWRATERVFTEEYAKLRDKAPDRTGRKDGARYDAWKAWDQNRNNADLAERSRMAKHYLKVLQAGEDEIQLMEEQERIKGLVMQERIEMLEEQAFFGEIFASTAPSLNTTFLAAGAIAGYDEFGPDPDSPEYDEFVEHAPAANMVLNVIETTFGDSAAVMPESDVMRALAKEIMRGEQAAASGEGEAPTVTREDLRAFFAYINDNRTDAGHALWRAAADIDLSEGERPGRVGELERSLVNEEQ
jgi:hypothetical protein